MNVMIAGGSGLIGSALTRALLQKNHRVQILTRQPARARLPRGAAPLAWDGKTLSGPALTALSQTDALINLAGATIGQWPWSAERKRQIIESRVNAGLALTRALESASPRPEVYLQASGVGYYGARGPESLTETSPAGNDFLAQVALEWEESSRLVDSLKVRRVTLRTGLVLDARAGALPLMALPVRFFAGGPLGDGKQGVSWIHLQDEVKAIVFLLEHDIAEGPFNLTAPNPLPNAVFMKALAEALGRPCWLPAPAPALRLALGEMSSLLLDGQFALPKKLTEHGFAFEFQTARAAFANLFD